MELRSRPDAGNLYDETLLSKVYCRRLVKPTVNKVWWELNSKESSGAEQEHFMC